MPFHEYIDACPARLKQLGLFEHVRFDKWPHTDELQPTATAVALVRLQREKQRRAEELLLEEKRLVEEKRAISSRASRVNLSNYCGSQRRSRLSSLTSSSSSSHGAYSRRRSSGSTTQRGGITHLRVHPNS